MLWCMLMCYWEDADWRGPPAVGSAAVLPVLLNYEFHSGSSLKSFFLQLLITQKIFREVYFFIMYNLLFDLQVSRGFL